MTICFTINKIKHCFTIPELVVPVIVHKPGPGPVNYPPLFEDAVLLASIQALANKVFDGGVRKPVQAGLDDATKALQALAGEHVTIQA